MASQSPFHLSDSMVVWLNASCLPECLSKPLNGLTLIISDVDIFIYCFPAWWEDGHQSCSKFPSAFFQICGADANDIICCSRTTVGSFYHETWSKLGVCWGEGKKRQHNPKKTRSSTMHRLQENWNTSYQIVVPHQEKKLRNFFIEKPLSFQPQHPTDCCQSKVIPQSSTNCFLVNLLVINMRRI